jgi:hypothetical protein
MAHHPPPNPGVPNVPWAALPGPGQSIRTPCLLAHPSTDMTPSSRHQRSLLQGYNFAHTSCHPRVPAGPGNFSAQGKTGGRSPHRPTAGQRWGRTSPWVTCPKSSSVGEVTPGSQAGQCTRRELRRVQQPKKTCRGGGAIVERRMESHDAVVPG